MLGIQLKFVRVIIIYDCVIIIYDCVWSRMFKCTCSCAGKFDACMRITVSCKDTSHPRHFGTGVKLYATNHCCQKGTVALPSVAMQHRSALKPHISTHQHTSPHINRTSPVYGHNCTSQHLYKPTNLHTVCVLNSSVQCRPIVPACHTTHYAWQRTQTVGKWRILM